MKVLFFLFFTMNAFGGTCEGLSRSPAVVEAIAENFREISSKVSNANYDLFDAIQVCDKKDILKALKHGAEVDATNDNYSGQTQRYSALIYAVKVDCVDGVEILLDKGANVEGVRAIDDNTPLMIAARHNRTDIAKLLLGHKANVNAGSTFGRGALTVAANHESNEIAKMILDHHEIDLNAEPFMGRNYLGAALFMGNTAIVDLILNHSAEISPMNETTIANALKWAKSDEDKAKIKKYAHDHSQE